jgi:chemotaxis protein MotB
MRRRNDAGCEDQESFSPWETYSDLYCGLLLVFVLLFFFAIYQYIDARESNNADTAALQERMREEQASVLALYKADLADQEAAYQEKNSQLESQQTALAILQSDLTERTELLDEQQQLIDEQTAQLEAQQTQLDEQAAVLEFQQSQLDGQQSKLDEQAAMLESQQDQLSEKQELLETQQEMLDSQAEQIEQIVGVRSQLIDQLNSELSANQIQIQADQETGAIIFESNILFAADSNELSEEGKIFFAKFMPVYLEVLLQPQFRDYIAEIIIEGHTDDSGSYLHNLELSQQRAWSVAEYFFDEDSTFLNSDSVSALKSLITVNGCADKAMIYREDGTVDADSSRRVEIKFRLKDQEMIQQMDEILNN